MTCKNSATLHSCHKIRWGYAVFYAPIYARSSGGLGTREHGFFTATEFTGPRSIRVFRDPGEQVWQVAGG